MTGLSHELRTPLNSIYGFAQVLERDEEIPKRRRNSITTIRRSSEHLAGLIDGLLDISRIEAGRLKLSRDRINLRIFLQQVSSIFEEAAREKNLTFTMETSEYLPVWVIFDEKRLRQIFINLLSNAIRYTERGEVSLKIRYRNEVAVIEVRDTGCGIADADRERIWEPFERGRSVQTQGSGLGLTITKLLVEILGGEIELESTLGRGSLFRVRVMLPAASKSTRDNLSENAVETEAMAVSGVIGSRKTLFIVDDDLNHLSLVDSFLSPLGFTVLAASSAEQALTMLDHITPDLFVLDIDLPGMDGYALAEHLRSGVHRAAPIIMISGHAMEMKAPPEQLKLCDGFIAKPYALDDFLVRIAETLGLELIYTETSAPQSAETVALSEKDRRALIDLARNGMAHALSDHIAELAEKGSLRGPLLVRLNKMVAVFDLGGIVETLEEAEDVVR
jgi:CheY-like chemotaxis protein